MWRFLFLLMAWPSLATAGAWLQPKGNGYSALQISAFRSDAFFDASGARQDQRGFSKYEANFYSEYGYRSWLTVGTNLFVNRASQGDDSNVGLADSEFFARMKLAEYEGFIASIQPLIKLPSLHEDRGAPRAGSRSFDTEMSLLISGNLPLISDRDYIDTRIGYRERSRHLRGQYRIDIAYGLGITDTVTLIPAFRSVISKKIDETAVFMEDSEQDYDLHKLELGLAWEYAPNEMALLSVYSHVAGRFTGDGDGITLGLGWRF